MTTARDKQQTVILDGWLRSLGVTYYLPSCKH